MPAKLGKLSAPPGQAESQVIASMETVINLLEIEKANWTQQREIAQRKIERCNRVITDLTRQRRQV